MYFTHSNTWNSFTETVPSFKETVPSFKETSSSLEKKTPKKTSKWHNFCHYFIDNQSQSKRNPLWASKWITREKGRPSTSVVHLGETLTPTPHMEDSFLPAGSSFCTLGTCHCQLPIQPRAIGVNCTKVLCMLYRSWRLPEWTSMSCCTESLSGEDDINDLSSAST